MGLGKKKKKVGKDQVEGPTMKPEPKSPLEIIEPFSATPSFTPRRKEPVVSPNTNGRHGNSETGSVVSADGSIISSGTTGTSATAAAVPGLFPVEHRALSTSGSSTTSSSAASYPPGGDGMVGCDCVTVMCSPDRSSLTLSLTLSISLSVSLSRSLSLSLSLVLSLSLSLSLHLSLSSF
eukprot:sb/3471733/